MAKAKVVPAPPSIPQAGKSVSQRLHELANQLQPVLQTNFQDREYSLLPPAKLKDVRSQIHKIADELNSAQTET